MVVASIGGQVTRAFTVFFTWLPHLVAALIVLAVGYLIAKVLGKAVGRALHKAGFDRALHSGQGGTMIQRVVGHPSGLLGKLTFWAVFLGAVSLAVSVLGVDALKNFVGSVYAYLPNVLAALLIFLVAGALAAAVAGLVARVMGDTSLGKIVAVVAPVLIMTLATFMILDQLKIAHDIVVITYAGLLGAIALGSAIAFGLGGRDTAAQLLQSAVEKGRESSDQIKQDLQKGRERAQAAAEPLKQRAGEASTPQPAQS